MPFDKKGAQEVQSSWFKFAKVGDGIKGTLVGKNRKEGDGDFGPQMIYKVKTEDGNLWNVAISESKQGTIDRLNLCAFGNIIGVEFDSEGEPPKKGFHKVKNLKVYDFGVDPNYKPNSDGAEEVSLPEDGALPPV